MARVLLGSAFHSFKDCNLHINSSEYHIPNWFTNIESFEYPHLDTYFIDNSPDLTYHKKIQSLGYDCDYIDTNDREPRFVVAECYEMIRKRVLDGGYDYLFIVECDNYPAFNALEHLLIDSEVLDAPVVLFPYFTAFARQGRILMEQIDRNKLLSDFVSKRVMEDSEAIIHMDGTIIEVDGGGFGCILIRSDILKFIKFRTEEVNYAFPDSVFGMDCYKQQIPILMDTKYICPHYNFDWCYTDAKAQLVKSN